MNSSKVNKIRVMLKCYDSKVLVSSCENMMDKARNNSHSVGMVTLPNDKRIYCVLRSPHVNKDSREHFEVRVHKRVLEFSPRDYTSEFISNLEVSSILEVISETDVNRHVEMSTIIYYC